MTSWRSLYYNHAIELKLWNIQIFFIMWHTRVEAMQSNRRVYARNKYIDLACLLTGHSFTQNASLSCPNTGVNCMLHIEAEWPLHSLHQVDWITDSSSIKCQHFYSMPQCSHCKRCTSYSNSVCLSVCPFVTLRYCVKTTAPNTVQFALSDSKMCLVL